LKKVDETPDTEPTLPTRAPAAIWFDDDEITKAFEATSVYKLPVMNNSSGLPIRYVVGPNVAGRVVEDNGEQYLITTETGAVEVTAVFDGNDDLESASTSVIVHIGEDQSSDDWTPEEVTPEEDDTEAKINPILRFERDVVFIEQNEDYNIYDIEDLYNPYNLPVVYHCINAIIDIDQSNKLLEIDELGEYRITADFAGDETYNPAVAGYWLYLIQKKDEPDQEQVVWNIDTSTQNVSTYTDETYTATIRPISITPSEFANDVKVYVNGTLLDSNSFVLDTAGTYTIMYVFEGNEYYDPSSTQYSIVYTQEARPKENVVWSIDTSIISVSTYTDETYTGTYRPISISPAALASDVKVYLDNTLLNSSSFTLSSEGTYTIRYVFEGNDYYNPSSTQYSIVYVQNQRQQYVTWGIDTSSVSVSTYTDETYTGTYREISISPAALASEVKVYLNDTLLNSNSFTLSSEGTYIIRYIFEGNASYYPSSTQYSIVYTQEARPYDAMYLTFEALESATFKLEPTGNSSNHDTLLPYTTLYYSLDNDYNWRTYSGSVSISAGHKVSWKASTLTISQIYNIGKFTSTGRFKVYGNIKSLITGDNLNGRLAGQTFSRMFYNNNKLVDASNLILPSNVSSSATSTGFYNRMFSGCTSLVSAPSIIPSIGSESCTYMFYGCTSLVNAPELPNYTEYGCYSNMFYGCTSLVDAPELPSTTTLASNCYESMFYGCTSLVDAPELPSTLLNIECYYQMFSGCTSLVNAPELPATTLYYRCYASMFLGCTSLVNAPELPADTLINNCYDSMFYNCTSLVNAPELPADTLINGCYRQMFYGCTSLNFVKALFITTPSSTYTQNWLNNVSSTGTFIMSDDATWDSTITRGGSTVPSGWTIKKEYADQYLAFEAIESSTFSFSLNDIQYSLDDGYTWTTLTAGSQTPTVQAGNHILWKASGLTPTSSNYGGIGTFSATGKFNVYGNILSLVNGDNFNSISSIARYQFASMFRNNTKLVSAENLILPSFNNNDAYIFFMSGCSNLTKAPKISHITLAAECFARMFERTALTETPVFSNATNAANRCYMYMFNGCTSLTKVYPLVHTTLSTNCYCGMFIDCRILANAPALPATTLSTGCYITMFQNCYALVKSPDLPATTLVTNCYQNMFLNCTHLTEVHALFTTEPSDTYTQNWLRNVAATGTFYKSPSATWDQTITRGISTVPAGWTITNES